MSTKEIHENPYISDQYKQNLAGTVGRIMELGVTPNRIRYNPMDNWPWVEMGLEPGGYINMLGCTLRIEPDLSAVPGYLAITREDDL